MNESIWYNLRNFFYQRNECYCGDSYGKYGKVSESECNFKCNGNFNEICGGVNRISIYSVRILIRSGI